MDLIPLITGKSWQYKGPPGEGSHLARLSAECPYQLPESYIQLMGLMNGAEGSLGVSPWWFRTWPVEEVMEANNEYAVAEFHPGYFAFGSSGGGVLLAFSVSFPDDPGVYAVPLDSTDPEDVSCVAENFLAFVSALGHTREESEPGT